LFENKELWRLYGSVAEEGVWERIKLLNWELNYGYAVYKSDQIRRDKTVDHVTFVGQK